MRTARLITVRRLLEEHFPSYDPGARAHYFETQDPDGHFSPERYYHVVERNGLPWIQQFAGHLNSAAISLYPILHYMGFREVYCLGMDMSMLGTMEYAASYTFRSMLAFRWYFFRTHHVFNAAYRPNRPYYFRPASEFDDLRQIAACPQLRITRVYSPWKYAAPVPGLATISLEEFATR